MTLGVAGSEEAEIMLFRKVSDQIRSMLKVVLLCDLGSAVAPQSKDVLNTLGLKYFRELVDLRLVVMQRSQMYNRLNAVPGLDILRDLDRTVTVAAAARTEGHADKVRLQLAKHLERLVDTLKLRVLLGRKNLK